MCPGTPAAKTPDWQSRLQGTWLIKVGDHTVTTLDDVTQATAAAATLDIPSLILLFVHPEIWPNLTHNGIPVVLLALFSLATHNQLNSLWEYTTVADYLCSLPPRYTTVESDDVQYITTQAMRLTCRKLLKQTDWADWQNSKYLQLDQYYNQGMLGNPHIPKDNNAVFYLVWTYNIKAVNCCKKAHCVCNGLPRAG
jgi:hypothetical protein